MKRQTVPVGEIIRRLKKAYPGAKCSLEHRDPLQLLVATILSAQCTDERVNRVTPALFRRCPDAEAFARIPQEELEELVRPTGFFRNKAKNIRAACARIVEAYGGRVPDAMEDLLTLPGVARKTANVVLGTAFGRAEGVVVDTHVHRVSGRIGFSSAPTPSKVEEDLMRLVPRGEWILFSHLMIHHGRKVCRAAKPSCADCCLLDLCAHPADPPAGWKRADRGRGAV